MKTGSFCGVSFSVSDSAIKTLNSFSWKSSSKWTTHQRIGLKDLPEMTGKSLDTVTFGMTLSAYFGVDPMAQYKKLQKIVEEGTIGSLVIGKTKIGTKWVATSSSVTAINYDREGTVATADISVTLQEYI